MLKEKVPQILYVKIVLFVILLLATAFFLLVFVFRVISFLISGDFNMLVGGVSFFGFSIVSMVAARKFKPAWDEFERVRGVPKKTATENLKESLPLRARAFFETTKYVVERFEYGRYITYDVKDVAGNLLGRVKGKRGSKPGYVEFWFTDNTGVQLGHIEGKLITVRRLYEIKDKDGQLKARIKQKVLQLFGSEWRMEDPAGQQLAKAEGDVLGHNFQILAPGGGVIAKIHRQWVSLRTLVGFDTYGIEILRQDFDPLLILGYTIAMDFVQYSGRLIMPP